MAVLVALPGLHWKEASAEAVNAIAYATRYHPEWFWRGAQHAPKRTAHYRGSRHRGRHCWHAAATPAEPSPRS